jgi:hypothetical protein
LSHNLNLTQVAGVWKGHEFESLRQKLSAGTPPLPCFLCHEAGAF